MTDWIDFFIYAVFLVMLWFVIPAMQSRFTLSLVADRNPDWLAAHPEFAARLSAAGWFSGTGYILGTLSLGALLSFQLNLWPAFSARWLESEAWMVLKDMTSASAIAGLLYLVASALLFGRWLHKRVPLAEHRRATLEPRSIGDFVPLPFQVVIYSIVLVHLAAWAIAAVLGRYSTNAFWGTLALQFVSSGFLFAVAHFCVRRRPNAMDYIFGPGLRRTEVRYTFAGQLIPLGNGVARLYEQVAGNVIVDLNRPLHLGLVLLMIVLFVRFALSRTTGEAGLQPRNFANLTR